MNISSQGRSRFVVYVTVHRIAKYAIQVPTHTKTLRGKHSSPTLFMCITLFFYLGSIAF